MDGQAFRRTLAKVLRQRYMMSVRKNESVAYRADSREDNLLGIATKNGRRYRRTGDFEGRIVLPPTARW